MKISDSEITKESLGRQQYPLILTGRMVGAKKRCVDLVSLEALLCVHSMLQMLIKHILGTSVWVRA